MFGLKNIFKKKSKEEKHEDWLARHKADGSHTYIKCKECGKEEWHWTNLYKVFKQTLCKNCRDKKAEIKNKEWELTNYCLPTKHNYLPVDDRDGYYIAICNKCGKKI